MEKNHIIYREISRSVFETKKEKGTKHSGRNKIVDRQGACVGCTNASSFAMTSEYDILSRNQREKRNSHILEGAKIMCAALHPQEMKKGNKIFSMQVNLEKDDLVFKASDLIKSRKHTEPTPLGAEGDDVDESQGRQRQLVFKRLSENFDEKVVLMGHYACAVKSLHDMGYYHLDINPQNLLIHVSGYTKKQQTQTSHIKGILHNFESSSAFPRGSSSSSSLATKTPIFTRTSRGHPVFRPPEHYHLHSLDGVEVGQRRRLHYRIDEKFDVWSVGMCFLHLFTELPVFVIHPGRLHMSAKGAERVEALEARKDSTSKEIANAILTECVRWQTFRLFGSTPSPSFPLTQHDKDESDLKRKISIASMVRGAVRRGIIPSLKESDAIEDLLFKMLNPRPDDRITIEQVCDHPVFKAKILSRLLPPPAGGGRGGTAPPPQTEWTKEKDEEVSKAMRRFAAETNSETYHLPVESVFVLFDILIRIANGMDKEAEKQISNTFAAASKVCFSLYDFSHSPLSFETDISRSLEPVVIEYLKGELRRPEYLFAHIKTDDQMKTLLHLMMTESSQDENAYVFRENYGRIEMKKFLREIFGKGYEMPPMTTTTKKKPPHQKMICDL